MKILILSKKFNKKLMVKKDGEKAYKTKNNLILLNEIFNKDKLI